MKNIEIYNDETVMVESNEMEFIFYMDNCCHAEKKIDCEGKVRLYGNIAMIHDVAAYFAIDDPSVNVFRGINDAGNQKIEQDDMTAYSDQKIK